VSTKEEKKKPKRQPIYLPKILANMMWATTKDSTCVSFGMGHRCLKHNQIFTLQHLASCSEIQGCQNITKFAKRIKEQHILDWEKEEREQAILEYTSLTVQMQNLTAQHRAKIVEVETPKHEPTGRPRGRPKATEKVAQTNHKVNEYFQKKNTKSKDSAKAPQKAAAPRTDDVEMIDTSSAPKR